MKKIITILFIFYLNILFADIYFGKVVGRNNQPLKDVIIYHKNNVTISNKKGRFILKNIIKSDTLFFHKIGYKDKIVLAKTLDSQKKIKMLLQPFQGKKIKVVGKESNVLPNLSDKIVIQNDIGNGSAIDLIENAPSVNIHGIGLNGEEQTASILGHHGRHTLVMIDGIAQNQDGKAYDLSQIPSEIIQNIEIITDNSGSEGGSGAIAGIININTKKSFGSNSVSFSKKIGSFGLQKESYGYSFGTINYNGIVHFDKVFSRNDFKYKQKVESHFEEIKRKNNEKKSYNFSSKMNYHKGNFHLDYSILTNQFQKYLPGNSEMLLLYENSHLDGYDINQRIDAGYSSKKYILKNSFYDNKKHSSYKNLLAPISMYKNYGISNYEIVGDVFKLKSTYHFPLNFETGLDYKKQSYKYDDVYFGLSNLPKTSQYNFGYFSKFIMNYEGFPISNKSILSLRYDKNERFNDFLSYKFSSQMKFTFLVETTIGGNIGNAESLPSFYNLYWKGDSQASGNPNLVPEKSKGYELFGSIKYDLLKLKFSYHKSDVENLIYWYRSFNGSWKPDNLVNAEYQNYVGNVELRISKNIRFVGNYTTTLALDKSKKDDGTHSQFWNKHIVYTPIYKQNYSLNYKSRVFKFQFGYQHTGKQWITRDNIYTPIKDYEILFIKNSFKLEFRKYNILLSSEFNNLLNTEYEIYQHTPQPGFNWGLSVIIKIKM